MKSSSPQIEIARLALWALPPNQRGALLAEFAGVTTSATESPELIPMRGVCHVLSVSKATGFRLMKQGLLKPVRLPGMRATRFRRAEVLALANGGET